MADEPNYTEFEQGERQALLQVRNFIIKNGKQEVDAYCAQRLHDIRQDRLKWDRDEKVDGGSAVAK